MLRHLFAAAGQALRSALSLPDRRRTLPAGDLSSAGQVYLGMIGMTCNEWVAMKANDRAARVKREFNPRDMGGPVDDNDVASMVLAINTRCIAGPSRLWDPNASSDAGAPADGSGGAPPTPGDASSPPSPPIGVSLPTILAPIESTISYRPGGAAAARVARVIGRRR